MEMEFLHSVAIISLICVPTCNCCFLSTRQKSKQWSWACSHQDTKYLKKFWILSHMKQQLGTRRGIYSNLLVVNLGIIKFCWYWSSVNILHQLTAVWYMNCNCVLLLVKTICSPSRGGGAKQKIAMVGAPQI